MAALPTIAVSDDAGLEGLALIMDRCEDIAFRFDLPAGKIVEGLVIKTAPRGETFVVTVYDWSPEREDYVGPGVEIDLSTVTTITYL